MYLSISIFVYIDILCTYNILMCGALPPTLNGTLKYCSNMEYWNIRILGKWNIGHLGAWSPGSWESEILGFWGPEACEPGGLRSLELGSLGAWRPGYLGNWKSGNLETWMAEELGKLGSWGPGKFPPPPKKCHFFIWPLGNFNKEFQLLGSFPRPGVSKWSATDCNRLQQTYGAKPP